MIDLENSLEEYLSITKEIEVLVRQTDFDEEQLLCLIEKRESVIEEMRHLLERGINISDAARHTIVPAIEELERIILPILERRKESINQTILTMKRAKNTQKNYQEFEYYEFGAYIDKKN